LAARNGIAESGGRGGEGGRRGKAARGAEKRAFSMASGCPDRKIAAPLSQSLTEEHRDRVREFSSECAAMGRAALERERERERESG
jgi:hypothetical protein